MQTQAICIVDDGSDDRPVLTGIFHDLPISNELLFFSSGRELLSYLDTAPQAPFIILSEVNLSQTDVTLRQSVSDRPEKPVNSVPFILWSSYASDKQVLKAYALVSQGFSIKSPGYENMLRDCRTLIDYWRISRVPTRVIV